MGNQNQLGNQNHMGNQNQSGNQNHMGNQKHRKLVNKKVVTRKKDMYALRVETQIRLTEDDGLLIRPDEELLYMKCRNPKNINSLLHPNLNSKY